MDWVCFSQIMERLSFSLPRLLGVIMVTTCEREVSDDPLDGYAAFVKEIISIIKTMTQEGVVDDVLYM